MQIRRSDNRLGEPRAATRLLADSKPDFLAPIEYEIPGTVALPFEAVSAEANKPILSLIEIAEAHSSELLHQPVSPEINKPDPTFNQYAWKPHEPGRLERTLATLSGWHAMAVPFLMQNIGWFIGVFCFIAGSMFLVS